VSQSVPGARQRQALTALLTTLDPAVLDLPDTLIGELSAGRDGHDDPAYDIEVFGDAGSPVFDIDAAAKAAADVTLADLLDPQRLQRVSDQGARQAGQLGLSELLETTIAYVFDARPLESRREALRRVVQARLVARLADVLADKAASPAVIASVRGELNLLGETLSHRRGGDVAGQAQAAWLSGLILDRSRDALAQMAAADKGFDPPPGMPIGDGGEACWFCDGAGARE
jgi:hypothetical protein